MDASFLLIHSPLLGPSSMTALGQTMRNAGLTAAVPDLRAGFQDGVVVLRETVGAAAEPLDGSLFLVGHSGAGVILPTLAESLRHRLAASVYVDAVLPPETGVFQVSRSMTDLLDANSEHGLLHRWIDWWPPEVMDEILPDESDRVELTSDMPTVRRAFYDEAVPVPNNWSSWPSVYLRTGGAYADEIAEAGRRNWPTRSIPGTHLSLFTDPATVFAAIESLLGELDL